MGLLLVLSRVEEEKEGRGKEPFIELMTSDHKLKSSREGSNEVSILKLCVQPQRGGGRVCRVP